MYNRYSQNHGAYSAPLNSYGNPDYNAPAYGPEYKYFEKEANHTHSGVSNSSDVFSNLLSQFGIYGKDSGDLLLLLIFLLILHDSAESPRSDELLLALGLLMLL